VSAHGRLPPGLKVLSKPADRTNHVQMSFGEPGEVAERRESVEGLLTKVGGWVSKEIRG